MMMNDGDVEMKLVELETKASFQEAALADMSAMIVAQAGRIDRLETTMRAMRDKLKDLSGEDQMPLPEHERPPHY
jgi:SlyX protein